MVVRSNYSAGAKTLHWTLVLIVAVQFLLAWTMPEVRRSTTPSELLSIHMSIGILAMPLAALLFLMRFFTPVQKTEQGSNPVQELLASAMHYILYALLLVVPFAGWAFASVRGFDVWAFGMYRLPALFASSSSVGKFIGESHSFFATTIGILVLGHAAAALYHHVVVKDRVLARMLP